MYARWITLASTAAVMLAITTAAEASNKPKGKCSIATPGAEVSLVAPEILFVGLLPLAAALLRRRRR